MKTLFVTAAALVMMSAVPAMAMSCCGKGKAGMCAKGDAMAMNMKGGKKGCCCEKMGGNMLKRA